MNRTVMLRIWLLMLSFGQFCWFVAAIDPGPNWTLNLAASFLVGASLAELEILVER